MDGGELKYSPFPSPIAWVFEKEFRVLGPDGEKVSYATCNKFKRFLSIKTSQDKCTVVVKIRGRNR